MAHAMLHDSAVPYGTGPRTLRYPALRAGLLSGRPCGTLRYKQLSQLGGWRGMHIRRTSPTAKVFFNLLQRLTLCLRKEDRRGQKKNDRETGKEKEHARVSVLSHHGEEDGRQRSRNQLVDHQRDTHSIRPYPGGHQLRER